MPEPEDLRRAHASVMLDAAALQPLRYGTQVVSADDSSRFFAGGISAGTPTQMIATIRWFYGSPTAARAAASPITPPVFRCVPSPSSTAASMMFCTAIIAAA